MPIIDDAVNDYLNALDSAEDEFLNDIQEMQESDFTTAEILAFLAALDVATYFTEDLRMASGVASAVGTTTGILDDLRFFGSATEDQLVALSNVQRSTLLKYSEYLGENYRQDIMTGIRANKSLADIKSDFARSSIISKARIDNIVADTVTNFEQSVIFTMAEDLPDDTLWTYILY